MQWYIVQVLYTLEMRQGLFAFEKGSRCYFVAPLVVFHVLCLSPQPSNILGIVLCNDILAMMMMH